MLRNGDCAERERGSNEERALMRGNVLRVRGREETMLRGECAERERELC